MSALPYLLPWILLLLAVALAVAVKFLPLKSIPGIAVTAVLGLLLLLVAVYSNLVTGQQNAALARHQAQVAEMEEWKYAQLDRLSLILAQMRPPTEAETALLKELISYGWLSDNAAIQRARAAHQARQQLLDSYEPGKPMLIKGIPTTVDQQIVELALRELGFIVLPYREDEQPETEVNIIYYGRDLALEEIKLTALTLMQAGVDLKAIKPFPQDTQGNLRAIRIEWNKYYESRKSLTVDGIVEASVFC